MKKELYISYIGIKEWESDVENWWKKSFKYSRPAS